MITELDDLLAEVRKLASTAPPTASPALAQLLSEGRTIETPTPMPALDPVLSTVRGRTWFRFPPIALPSRSFGFGFGVKLGFAAAAAAAVTAVVLVAPVSVAAGPISAPMTPTATGSAAPRAAGGRPWFLPRFPLPTRAANPTAPVVVVPLHHAGHDSGPDGADLPDGGNTGRPGGTGPDGNHGGSRPHENGPSKGRSDQNTGGHQKNGNASADHGRGGGHHGSASGQTRGHHDGKARAAETTAAARVPTVADPHLPE